MFIDLKHTLPQLILADAPSLVFSMQSVANHLSAFSGVLRFAMREPTKESSTLL